MARSLLAALTLLSVTVQSVRALEIPDEVASAADDASVDPLDLFGAVVTTNMEPREYLYAVGELQRPLPVNPFGWPIGGGLGQRIYCVEGIESHHGVAMYNPISVSGEHAQGWLGYLPSTARHWGVQIGNRASEWAGAAQILAQGERFARTQFYGIGAGLC